MKIFKTLSFLLYFLVVFSMNSQSAKLQYNLKKGDKYLIEMQMKQNMAPIMTMDIGMSMIMKTTGSQGGKINMQYQISKMKMDMSAQGEYISFDSEKADSELSEEERKMKAEMSVALKMIMYQTIDKKGKVISQKVEPQVKEAAAMVSQNQFTNMVYPTEPVKVGSSWNNDKNMSGMSLKATYKVTKITSDKVYADMTGGMTGATDTKIGGKVIIDIASGMMNSMNFDISINSGMGGMKMGVKMTSKKI